MSMNLYLGNENKKYRKKFNALKEEFMNKAGTSSNAGIFRYIIDVLYKELNRRDKDNDKGDIWLIRYEMDIAT